MGALDVIGLEVQRVGQFPAEGAFIAEASNDCGEVFRNLLDLRTSTAFESLYRAIWSVLREEVVKSQSKAERV